MSFETMLTRAVLEDQFTPVLRKIAGGMDAFERKTNQINAVGNAFLAAGSAALAFGVKSIKVAGQLDYIKKSMAAVEGANRAAFDMQYVDRFAQKSMFTYMDLAEAARKLAIQNVSVKDNLQDIADISASSGKGLPQISGLYDALLAGGRVGLALSARGGFAQYGISVKEIFAAAGKEYNPKNLQNSMTPKEVADAVHKVLMQTGKAGLNEKLATTTLTGVTGMLEDAVTRLENSVGKADLPATIGLLNKTAGAINRLAEAVAKVPGFGDKLMLGAGGAILAGAVLKGVAAYRQYTSILKIASAVGATERAGEMEKVGIAAKEGAAVAESAGRWTKYAGAISFVTKNIGALTKGFALLLAAKTAVDVFSDPQGQFFNNAYNDFRRNQGGAFMDKLKDPFGTISSLPARMKGGASGEFTRYATAGQSIIEGSKWKEGIDAFHRLMPEIARIENSWGKVSDAEIIKTAERLHTIVENTRKYLVTPPDIADPGDRPGKDDAAGNDANGYKIPAKLDYEIKASERKVQLLEAEKAAAKQINAAKQDEIKYLMQAAGLLRKNAALATDEDAKYRMLNEADEDQQKARLLKLKDTKGAFEKVAATIISSAGLGEDEILKQAGIGGRFFKSLGGKHGALPQDPLKAALTDIRAHLQQRPFVFQFHIGDKVVQQMTVKVKDEVIHELLQVLGGSSVRPRLAGH